jgi:redox-sensitive bicupin YhaK (pirin superfamily)
MSFLPAVEPKTSTAAPSSPVQEIVDARVREVGGIPVRRVLPIRAGRGVGPFVFFDHMGPVGFAAGDGLDVLPHPHIGLATVTFVLEGEIVHRDSLGSAQTIRRGDVNLMIAGRGIAHSERTDAAARRSPSRLHALQLWVALPHAEEECAPSFHHHDAATLPLCEDRGVRIRVLAGDAFGFRSPVRTLSPLFYADIHLPAGGSIDLPGAHDERAAYVVEGAVRCGSVRGGPGRMLVFVPGRDVSLVATEPSRLVLLGGAPLDGPRHIWWNFVSSSRERLLRATRDWKAGRFAPVIGDEVEFTPLPE